jgi:hypothetical protein
VKRPTESTKRIAPNNSQLDVFRLPRLRFFRDFSSVVRRMPGYKLMQNQGTARTPPQALRLHKVPVHSHAFKSRDSATLGSNPRKPSNQSMPSHVRVFNKSNLVSVKHNPCIRIVSLLLSPEMRSHAGMAKQTRGPRPLVRPLVGWLDGCARVQWYTDPGVLC